MSTLYSISSDTLTGLADAVRGLTGTSAPLSPDDMINGIEGHVCPSPTINPLSVTQNGEYTAPSGVDGYSPITVNVSGGGGGGANTQVLFASGSNNTNTMVTLLSSITVNKTGTYTVGWTMARNNTSGDIWTQLRINDVGYESRISFTNYPTVFNRMALPLLHNVPLNEGDVLTVMGGYQNSSSGTAYAANLIIQEETA